MSTTTKKKTPPPVVKIASPKQWTGGAIYKECKAQGLFPSFDSGNFTGYIDKGTNKKVAATTLPTMSNIMHDAYLKAQMDDVERIKAKKVEKPKKEKVVKAVKPKKSGTSRKRHVIDGKKIHILVKENPYREATQRHEQFAMYKEGMAVENFLKISAHLNTPYYKEKTGYTFMIKDVLKGFISLS